MAKLSNEEKDEIKQIADEHFDGDLSLAIAAHVHGIGVVKKSGGRVPTFANKRVLSNLKTQIAGKKPKTDTPPKRQTK
jgi:hypothetical protein